MIAAPPAPPGSPLFYIGLVAIGLAVLGTTWRWAKRKLKRNFRDVHPLWAIVAIIGIALIVLST